MDIKTKNYLKQCSVEILGRPWLFPAHNRNVPMMDYGTYLEWFRRNYKVEFITHIFPGYFNIGVIDQFKSNVVLTAAMFSGQARPIVTILQFSPGEHAHVSYIFDDDNKIRLQIELSTNNPPRIPEFYETIKKNSCISEDIQEVSGFGFGAVRR